VFLPAGTDGNFTVVVTAANINSDGVPNEDPPLDQDFALVIYNGTAQNVPAYTPIATTYAGLFSEPGNVELGKSGAITLNATLSGAYSGKLQLGASSYSFSGTFDPSGAATNAVNRKGASPLGLALNISVNDNSILTGTVTDGSWIANVQAYAANSKTTPTALAGQYTLVFPGTPGDSQLPAGNGYATMTLSTAGQIKMTGSLADGTKLSQSTLSTVNGQWPLYVSLYGGQGQVLGWLFLTNSGISGDVNWIKNAIPNAKFYPTGFETDIQVLGSIYNRSAAPLIGFANGVVILTDGDLPGAVTNNVTVNGTSATGDNSLALKLSGRNGMLKGTVANPFGGAKIPFNGVFLQNQNFGLGYFLGTDQSGGVFFGPGN
jgi:hypothetical protein